MKSFPHIVDKMSLTFFQASWKTLYPHVIHKILGISFLPVLLKTFLIYISLFCSNISNIHFGTLRALYFLTTLNFLQILSLPS
mgnify:CR=1 FL=1